VTALLNLLRLIPAEEILNCKDSDNSKCWQGHRVERFCTVLRLLSDEGIESEADLREWLAEGANLPKLRAIHGLGPKTVDYLKILAVSCHRQPPPQIYRHGWGREWCRRLRDGKRYCEPRSGPALGSEVPA
jgi:hypothetical protein